MALEGRNKVIFFVTLPVLLVTGLLLLILSCALFNTFKPLFVLPALLLTPVPNLLAGFVSSDPLFSQPSGPAVEVSLFLTTFLATSGLLIPVLLWHIDSIPQSSMLFAVGGCLVMYVAIALYQIFFNVEEDSSF